MKNSEKQELKKKIKRLMLFFGIVLVPCLFISTLMIIAQVEQWLNMFVLVICLFIFYFLYVFVCAKLDARKENRLKNKKDPFSD